MNLLTQIHKKDKSAASRERIKNLKKPNISKNWNKSINIKDKNKNKNVTFFCFYYAYELDYTCIIKS